MTFLWLAIDEPPIALEWSGVHGHGSLRLTEEWNKNTHNVILGGVEMAKYGKKASKKVEKAMHERKRGTLKSGKSGKKVTSKKQAIAIGLSEARKEGAKVPKKKSSSKKK